MMTLNQALALIQQQIPQARLIGDGQTLLARVHTDTRSLQPGDLFVALKGERFDANDFLAQAKSSGAAAALAHPGRLVDSGLPGIEVDDSLAALGVLAQAWRAQFILPLIAVTGSNGKTTVTQMIAAILSAQAGAQALATRGNFNNAIGVPLTLLRLTPAHRLAVVELGMNHPGEIAELAKMAQPTVALVNNAQREHLEFMHSVQAVAEENGAVLAALPADGVAVFPAGEEFTPVWQALAQQRPCLLFGDQEHGAPVYALQATWQQGAWQVRIATPAGEFDARLQIAGRHNVRNALAATACALAAGVPLVAIAAGLSAFVPVTGRSRALSVQVGGRSITLIDDSYNANPDSMLAAIDVLAELPAPRWLVMGDMGEVGNQGPQFHAEAGAYAREKGIERLLALGAQSTHAVSAAGSAAEHFADMATLLAAVREGLPTVGSLLIKGSRFMKMEQVVQAVSACADSAAAEAAC